MDDELKSLNHTVWNSDEAVIRGYTRNQEEENTRVDQRKLWQ